MNRQLGAELLEAVNALDGDDRIGCLVVTGAGEKAFSASGTKRDTQAME
jgi:enoyl-CoA hydratase/carnithine racemase